MSATRSTLIITKIFVHMEEVPTRTTGEPLYKLRHNVNRDAFENQILGTIAATTGEDSDISMLQIKSFDVPKPDRGEELEKYEKIKEEMKVLRDMIGSETFGCEDWDDGRKLAKEINLSGGFETDFYVKFMGGQFSAKDLLGSCTDRSVSPPRQVDWEAVELEDKYLLLEVTSDPRVLRHKVFQLARAVLLMPISDQPLLPQNIGLLGISVNGSERDFAARSNPIVDCWRNLWAPIDGDSEVMARLKRDMNRIPFVIIWTARRNLYHSSKMVEQSILRLERNMMVIAFIAFIAIVIGGIAIVIGGIALHQFFMVKDEVVMVNSRLDRIEEILLTPFWKRLFL